MALLSPSSAQTDNTFRQVRQGSGMRAATGTTGAHWATIKRFCLFALAILLVGGAVAGIVALKTAFYLSHLN
jgi:hypothetical protein